MSATTTEELPIPAGSRSPAPGLVVVSTPIGNLEDMTPRALRALREASAVYCEDTRRTRALLSHFGLSKSVERYDEHHPASADRLLRLLRDGRSVALVSDGGLPGISDPGRRIVELARAARIPVTVIPGPCAVAAAVAGSGLPGDSFVFLGFLPRSASRRKRALAEAAALRRTIAVYESPFRILDLLDLAAEVLGPEAPACVARELSKVHEEWLRGPISEVRSRLAGRPEILGEIVALFHPGAKDEGSEEGP